MDLVPKVGRHVAARYGYLAGKDRERADDINAMYADKDVRAVFAVRGGWGSARVLPYLDWAVIRANPKLLIGFSDITAMHMAFAARAGFTTIHGPGAGSDWTKFSLDAFRGLVFDGVNARLPCPAGAEDRLVQRAGRTRTFRPGKAAGRLLGGNLTVLTALMGTPYLPDFDGAILFLEDTNEAEYRIDRMMTQLALGGVLRRVAGVVFGQCTDCRAAVLLTAASRCPKCSSSIWSRSACRRSRALRSATFRTRSACPSGCGRRSMPAPARSASWSRP
jgi:muramoyltetrapeptide carboxypeptidase